MISAGETATSNTGTSTAGISCPVDRIDYPALERRIADIALRIRAHPHYIWRAGGKADFKTSQKRGDNWLEGYLS